MLPWRGVVGSVREHCFVEHTHFWQMFCKEVPVGFSRQAAFLAKVFTEAEWSC